ncbi:hypothetical protein EMCRGX_G000994 [Ephydatia muelleri]
MCMRPDSTDVPTIYWRVNSSSLDGALLLDFITHGPSYEPFIHIGLLRLKSRKFVSLLGTRKNLAAKLSCTPGVYATYKPEPQKERAAKDNDIVRVLNMLIQRKVKATQSS